MDDVGIEQLLSDDGDDSTLAISRNDSAVKPSGEDSDGGFAAKTEVLDLNQRDDGIPNEIIDKTDRKSSTQADGQKIYSVHPRADLKPHQTGCLSRSCSRSRSRESAQRKQRRTGKSPLALNQFDPPKQPDSTVQTNVLPPISIGVVYLCRISCKPAAMPAQQKRMLIQEFLHHLNVTPCLGQLVFLNGRTFLTKDPYLRTPLIKNLFLGSFSCRTSKVDEKSKLIRNGSESFWSNLYHGRLIQKPHAISKVPVRDTYDNSEPFEASASCTVETIDFSNFCGPKRHQGTRDLKKYISDFNNLYSPGLPNIAPDAPEREQIIVRGNKTFDFRQVGYSLGFGLEVRNGALLIVRATEKGLVRVVSPCQRIFFAPMKASSFMTAHWPDYALDPIKASADFDSVLRGLCVVVQQANGVKRRATVSEVLRTCPSDTVFEVVDRGVQSRTTVEEYFSRRACTECSRDKCLTN